MEDVPSEFECSLCLKLLLDPISVSCGHTFCRQCIHRSQEYRTACPMCRKPVTVGGGVNVLVANIIADRYPVTLEERKQERAAELTFVEARQITTLPMVSLNESLVPGHHGMFAVSDEDDAAYQAAIKGGHTIIIRGPIISTVCTIEHLANKECRVKCLYRCIAENEAVGEGYLLAQAREVEDDALPSSQLTDEESSLYTMWDEVVILIDTMLSKMGDSGRAVFFNHHGRIPNLVPNDSTATSAVTASWWLCGAVIGPEERYLTTNTLARIESSLQVLRGAKHQLCPPFVMPGGQPWALGGRQSLLLLLVIVFVLALKYAGIIGGR